MGSRKERRWEYIDPPQPPYSSLAEAVESISDPRNPERHLAFDLDAALPLGLAFDSTSSPLLSALASSDLSDAFSGGGTVVGWSHPQLHLYEARDGHAKYWIAARSIRNAIHVFFFHLSSDLGIDDDELESCKFSFAAISPERGDILNLTDEAGNRIRSMSEECRRQTVPCVLASNVS